MKRGGTNIFKVKDSCGLLDCVKGVLWYKGGTSRSVDINSDGTCNANDGKSVIGFGDLPSSYTAFACVSSWIKEGALNRVVQSDIRLNKEDHAWSARVTGSCRGVTTSSRP